MNDYAGQHLSKAERYRLARGLRRAGSIAALQRALKAAKSRVPSAATISGIAQEYGIATKMGRPSGTGGRHHSPARETTLALDALGYTVAEIAAELEMSQSAIKYLLRTATAEEK